MGVNASGGAIFETLDGGGIVYELKHEHKLSRDCQSLFEVRIAAGIHKFGVQARHPNASLAALWPEYLDF